METVEHFARINFVAEMLGGARSLPRGEVDKLFEARGRYGVQSNAVQQPGCPVSAEDAINIGRGADGQERYTVTRDELLQMVEEAVRLRQ